MQSIINLTHLIIDMDGVLYLGDQPIPYLCEFITFLREQSIEFLLVTNNSTRTPQDYVNKLAGMGVTISPNEILNSGQATASFLARQYPCGTRIHVFGMEALKQTLANAGFILAENNVELVVASMDRDLTYEKLKKASLLIRDGAHFIATNLDPTYPSEEGLLPGTGSLITALSAATATKPTAIGKPEPIMFELAIDQMQAAKETTAVIGDRVDTDILGGKKAGLTTICVLSGSSTLQEAEAIEADYIFDNIGHLLNVWNRELQLFNELSSSN